MGTISLESVFEAYYECRKHKRRTANAAKFELDYENNLVLLWKDINNRQYEISRSICFAVTRPKLREVFAADFRDRIVHHIVMLRLEPLFEKVFIEDNYNCRKNKGVLFGVTRLYERIKTVSDNYTKDCWIGKFDMTGFFMSIDKNILWDKLYTFIQELYNEDDKDLVLYLTKKILFNQPELNCVIKGNPNLLKQLPKNKSLFTCGENKGLPIGNLTSLIFANFYLHEFDIAMLLKYLNYGRYVDDFWVLCKNKDLIIESKNFAKVFLKDNLGVELSNNKVYIQPYWHGVLFIGTMLKLNRRYIGNRTVYNILTKLNKFESVENALCVINSYYGFMKHCNTYHIRRKISKLLSADLYEHVYIDDNFLCVKLIK